MLIVILILTSKNKVFITGNIVVFFKFKVVAAKRKNLSIYIILYYCLYDWPITNYLIIVLNNNYKSSNGGEY